ncbi:MAG: glycosyltransferase family 39 protein [Chloroflexi bacterium]|nr:glycosyltransferase family 39 protein [Chloroflexota bacterium]
MQSVKSKWLGALFLAAVVIFIYASSLSTGFFADDYNFLEPVARLDTPAYLAHYFDPRVQEMWYRPLQGIQILIEWQLFGAEARGYHLVQILIHIVNCLLLWWLVARVSKQAHLGWLAALLYALLPVYALAINWINITDPIMTSFYLAGIWFWLNYLESNRRRDYALTIALFGAALLFKQMALTLPAILFLLDVLLVNSKDVIASEAKQSRTDQGIASSQTALLAMTVKRWLRRYLAFGVVVLLYFAIQYGTRSTHTFAGVFGYTLGPHVVSILVQYLSLLAFPWGYYPASDTQIIDVLPDFIAPAQIVWMFAAVGLYLFLIWRTRSRPLIFLGAALLVMLLPVLPFPFIELRYLYLPAMIAGIWLALLFDHALNLSRLSRLSPLSRFLRLSRFFAPVALALLVVGNASAIANANAGIAEIARQRRVPFRDISRAHPTFPDDTRLYFIDPISPLSELTGMFMLRYGRGVTVSGDSKGVADLRAHRAAFVYYFDETGKPIEIAADARGLARASLVLPAAFNAPIRLEGFEIPRATVQRGESLVLLLYWRATGPIGKDYTVFVHLVDLNGTRVGGEDRTPRKGTAPTRTWILGALVVDPILLVMPADATAGEYRLEIGMYDLATAERLQFVDAQGTPIADKLTLAPIVIEP